MWLLLSSLLNQRDVMLAVLTSDSDKDRCAHLQVMSISYSLCMVSYHMLNFSMLGGGGCDFPLL